MWEREHINRLIRHMYMVYVCIGKEVLENDGSALVINTTNVEMELLRLVFI